MSLDGGFAVGAEDVDRRSDFFMDFLHEFLDWFTEDGAFGGGEGEEVGLREGRDFGGAGGLFAATMMEYVQ